MDFLINKVKQKKELSGISDKVVLNVIEKQLKKYPSPLSNSSIKKIIKETRAQLRQYSGRFKSSLKDQISLLQLNKIDSLLNTHSSTKERIDFYPKLKEIIKELKIKSILDLGSGINPIALAEKGVFYHASDINENDLKIVNGFFEKSGIAGKAFVQDLTKDFSYPSADLTLIFKVFDVIEKKGHKLAEKIISSLNSKNIIVSFPTKTLSGKPMNHPQRGWIERMLSRLGHSFKTFSSKNEIFYLIEKH